MEQATEFYHFNTLGDFIKATEKMPVYHGFGEWAGVKTREEYEKIVREGWYPRESDIGLDVSMGIEDAFSISHNQVGFMPDVARYLSGEQEYMFSCSTTPSPVQSVKLCVQINCNGYVSSEDMTAYNIRVINAVKELQRKGIEVNLMGLLYNRFGRKIEQLTIDLINNGVINQAILGTAMHVSNFRITWFRWAEAKYGSCGGSIKAPSMINGHHVLPSVEFSEGIDLKEWVMDIVNNQQTASVC